MRFGKKRFNTYRKRTFTSTDNQRREYAAKMDELSEEFSKLEGWSLSSAKDSAYKHFDNYQVRLSNHSAENDYHDLENGYLLINIKASKLDFVKIIKTQLDEILKKINELDLEKYRFINVTKSNINCYYKGFKTKKDTIIL